METLCRVRIGHRAPDFHCDAVVKGLIEEVTLANFISDKKPQWLILLFIPAAFSFVCPTEVLAFQNCLEEFHDRNCEVVFVSVDTKHSLWHWQNVPRQYGGLGQIDIALLSDANHKMSKDYGVLIEEEGVCLRGMFILDDKGVVQQVTLNNLTVGRSVLEALRLLEAFQAVAKHGVLCPIDWKPSSNADETIRTISNTLTESYDERLANLQKEFGDTPITDLDAKHKKDEDERRREELQRNPSGTKSNHASSGASSRTHSGSAGNNLTKVDEEKSRELMTDSPTPFVKLSNIDCLPRRSTDKVLTTHSRSNSAPASASVTPTPTPCTPHPPALAKKTSIGSTARHSRGHSTIPHPPHTHNKSKPPHPRHQHSHIHSLQHNTYESRRGSHVVLEFADPTSSPQKSPNTTPNQLISSPLPHSSHLFHNTPSLPATPSATSSHASSPGLSRSASLNHYPTSRISNEKDGRSNTPSPNATPGGSAPQTRLQMTFEAIKKMSAGLASPRVDFSPKRGTGLGGKVEGEDQGSGMKSVGSEAHERGGEGRGYFDVIVDGVEA